MKRIKSLLPTVNKVRSTDVLAHPVGFETLFEGVAPIEADVVFVHGLCGHPRNTWTSKNNVCWPEDLLSKEESLSHIRILTFGYDVDLNGGASLNSLFDHSINLLNDLSRERKRDASDRPIIFVAHSLGGLIVKDALDRADRVRDTHPRLTNIFSASRGIIFLGTPHRGSDSASLSKIVASVSQVALSNSNIDLIRSLEKDSQTLDRIRDGFSRILDKRRLTIWSFAEELPMRGVEKVVFGDSAVIGDAREHRGTIYADHLGMAAFSSRNDPDYKKVLYAIEMLIEALREDTGEQEGKSGTAEARKATTFYNIPPLHLPHFVTRNALALLENLFKSPTTSQSIIVVIGMGGVGKTQLVLELCRRMKGAGIFEGIFWLDSSSRGALCRAMEAIARQLSPERVLDDPGAAVTHVKDVLSGWRDRWLMVFDNLDNPDDLRGFLEFIPDSRFGSIVVTSRFTGSKELGQSIELDCMEKDEGLQLLLRSQEVDAEELVAAEEILSRLGYLPLAIDQARAYISKRQLRFRDFMDEYETRKGKVMREVPQFWQYRRTQPSTEQEIALSLVTTWEMSLSLLEAGYDSASKLGGVLTLFAHFHPVNISEFIFSCGQDETTSPMSIFTDDGVWDHVEFEDAVAKMRELSLVQFSRRSESEIIVSLHAMVSEWLRMRLDKDSQSTFLAFTVSHLRRYLDQTDHEDFETRRETLSHLYTVSQAMESSSDQNSFFEALHTFACFSRSCGHLDDAERMYNRALSGKEDILGPVHVSTLHTVNNLGNVYTDQGRLDDAERMYDRSLCGREKVLGLDHADTLSTVNNLGFLYFSKGRLDDAEQMYNRAIAGTEKALGCDHMRTLGTVSNLGLLYLDQGRLDDAERMYNRALAGCEKDFGLDHMHTLDNVGRLYVAQGRFCDAERMHNRVLACREKTLGLDHMSTLCTVDNIARLYVAQGRLDEAERMYERALAGCEKGLGRDHIHTLEVVNNLGFLYVDQGRLDDAERMYHRALAGRMKVFGPNHMSTLITIKNLGLLYEKQGRIEDAEKMYRRGKEDSGALLP